MVRVFIYQHHLFFTVRFKDVRDVKIISPLLYNLTTYEFVWNRNLKSHVRVPSRIYYEESNTKVQWYRFPIAQARTFMYLLRQSGVTRDEIEIHIAKDFDVAKLNLKVNKKYKLRDYQKQYRDQILNGKKSIYLIDAKTGSGKGLTSCATLCGLNMRTVILVLPKFVDKWVYDALEYTNVKKDAIVTIQGRDSLVDLLNNQDLLDDEKIKFIIISLRTMSNYIRDWLKFGQESGYPIHPDDLLLRLRAGVIYNDETHLDFHALSRSLLYLDARKFIGSTATFDSNNKQLKRIYNYIIPPDQRISNLVKRDPYVDAVAVRYHLQRSPVIRFERDKGYSHNLYEQTLMRSRIGMINYEKMILFYIDKYYIQRKSNSDKCLLFFASIEFCGHFVNVLKSKYRDLKIARFVEGDGYDELMSSDICCSTVLKAGTGMDLPNLITVIQTISIYSLQSNLQSFGRLRKLDNRDLKFIWFWTSDIPNQTRLHHERLRLLQSEFKIYEEELYEPVIKTR